jgi:hypothetical protein
VVAPVGVPLVVDGTSTMRRAADCPWQYQRHLEPRPEDEQPTTVKPLVSAPLPPCASSKNITKAPRDVTACKAPPPRS